MSRLGSSTVSRRLALRMSPGSRTPTCVPDRLVAVVVGPPDEVDSRLDPLGLGPPSLVD